nr:hypothetical protein [Deltaproteobacteria bacterium]
FTPPEVRIVGHSLGNQLAVDLAYRVLAAIEDGELDPNLLPTRVALLDPFYTNGGKDYLGGEQTGERVRRYARALRESGVLLESYRSSVVANNPFVGDTNRELMGMVAFQNVQPKFLDTTQLVAKHKYAKQFYFDTYNGLEWSLEPDPRTSKLPAEASLSANSDSETVRDAMRSCLKFVQSKGQYTMDYTDDAFSTKEKAMPTDDCI